MVSVVERRRKSSAPKQRRGSAAHLAFLQLNVSASRSEEMTVAVGFSPRQSNERFCVAERRLNALAGLIQTSLRDARFNGTVIRGLKPTATVIKSLRD